MAGLAIIGFVIVENTMIMAKQDYFDEKIEASEMSKKAFDYLKDYRMSNVLYMDNINDPNETGIIGQKYSQITTESSSLPIKLSTTNPNFSALAVQLLKDAGAEKGDRVAVCMSGSYPALDISVLAAMQVLQLKPVVIISTTSSSWGANNPDFTILDMVRTLQYASFFKDFEIKYASIGGVQDLGMGLSKKGRKLVAEAIDRNNFIMLNKGEFQANIDQRIQIIDKFSEQEPVKVFINIGGGVASLGSSDNGKAIRPGLNKKIKLRKIPNKLGVVYEMAKRGTPVIHFSNLRSLLKEYDLPKNPIPLPEAGAGELFRILKYDMKIVWTVTLSLFFVIAFFVYFDRKNNKLGNDIVSDEIQI